MTNEEIARFFNNTRAFIQGNPDLRDLQVEGWRQNQQAFSWWEAGTLLTIGIYGDNLSEKREKGGWLCQEGRGKNGGKSVQQLIYQSDEEKKRPKEKR